MPYVEPADLEPLDVDGVLAVRLGTAAWTVALLALLPFAGRLADDGRLWWIGTCAAGAALGALGTWHVTRRRTALRAVRSGRAPR